MTILQQTTTNNNNNNNMERMIRVREDGTRHAGCDESSGWLWYAARHLLDVLVADEHDQLVQGLRILELGSGTGWLGLHLAARGAVVTVTERKGALPLLIRNVLSNTERLSDEQKMELNIQAYELNWSDEDTIVPGEYDLVVGSDLVYLPEYYQDMLHTVLRHQCRRFILAWEERRPLEEQGFLTLATAMGFIIEQRKGTINPTTGNPIWVVALTI